MSRNKSKTTQKYPQHDFPMLTMQGLAVNWLIFMHPFLCHLRDADRLCRYPQEMVRSEGREPKFCLTTETFFFSEQLGQEPDCSRREALENQGLTVIALFYTFISQVLFEGLLLLRHGLSRHLVFISEQDLSLCTEAQSLLGKMNISIITIKYSEINEHMVLRNYRRMV